MKTKLLFVTALIALFLVACSEEDMDLVTNDEEPEVLYENKENNTIITKNNNKKETSKQKPAQTGDILEDVVKHFKDEGYDIGERTVKAYEMIGAIAGFGVDVNGKQIGFYIYEPNSEGLKEIQSTGQYNMSGFVVDAEHNGNLVMIEHHQHPDKNKLIETFNTYK